MEASGLDGLDVGEIGEVELDLAVETRDRVIQIAAVPLPEVMESGEYIRVELRDQAQHTRLDMVHAPGSGKPDPVVLHRALPELLEGRQDLPAVVVFPGVFTDPYPVSLDVQGIGNAGQILAELCGLGRQ